MDFLLEDAEKPYGIRHRCFFFAKSIIVFVKACKYDYVFRSLFDQLIRSAASVGANVVEGRAGSSKKDWLRFLTIALKSSNEVKYWLCLIRYTLDVDRKKFNELLTEADEISKIIASIIINAGKKTKES
jgi:four helix bundle protein